MFVYRNAPATAILHALRDDNTYDPRHRIEINQAYIPQLLRGDKVESQLKVFDNGPPSPVIV